ncbi:aminopeptidase N [Thioalkalivibrio sp. HK1]|uniref:aminopeptidase N n=1 Tax=Thioalkalivibrio sp. HK1 TaxID=1469245 RepID=UPI000470E4D3|nr:aminopeptidase N [Thioalkalivibrio sp. HK1]
MDFVAETNDSAEPAKATGTRLEDYTPPPFLVDTVSLDFALDDECTQVHSSMSIRRNPAAARHADLVLDGKRLKTLSVHLDGQALADNRIAIGEETLTVHDVPDTFTLATSVEIQPGSNKSLEGLYASSGNLCTQCEAEGFRRITWFLDRPDVMARYRTRLIADANRYPILLSNGNDVERGTLDDGRHFTVWEDPFPKPCYLFALVAGRLECIEDRFKTRSGRDITLRIYVQKHNIDRCDHAMDSLKRAMRWDEEVWDLEYDLDTFMIVAVDDFNMGAMENKGLNIFNSHYILARPDTATDRDFAAIESVVAHEYFHNWTGNRVTCRDWFQLSLKEGLTVFRDQEFSADMSSRAVKRIKDVHIMRNHQFAEDAGPMAHPVQPDEYQEIGNFYTLTIYHKGAEVIRMMHALIGQEAFKAGMRLYFQRHDGQAVTIDDFVRSMEDASGTDLRQFRRWYRQAGTPTLDIRTRHDEARSEYRIEVHQHTPATPGQPEKSPQHLPLRIALFAKDGRPLPLHCEAAALSGESEATLDIKNEREEFRFSNIPSPAVPSILRGFSAPVKIEIERSDDELVFLIAHESDPFNRWDAAQEYAMRLMLERIEDPSRDSAPGKAPEKEKDSAADFIDALRRLLLDRKMDPALIADALTLPLESSIADRMTDRGQRIAIDAIHEVREGLRLQIACQLADDLSSVRKACHSEAPYRFVGVDVGRRSLKNLCLDYLMELNDPKTRKDCIRQFESANNMTDTLAALRCLANDSEGEARDPLIESFHDRWKNDPLVIDKWFSIQATGRRPDTLERVVELMAYPTFDITNPNRVRSLIGAFCHANQHRFHDISGEGYRFFGRYALEIDGFNPQVAARLFQAASRWRHLDDHRSDLLRRELEHALESPDLSKDSHEVISKTLA